MGVHILAWGGVAKPIKDATATPADVASGKVFYNNDGRHVGSLQVDGYQLMISKFGAENIKSFTFIPANLKYNSYTQVYNSNGSFNHYFYNYDDPVQAIYGGSSSADYFKKTCTFADGTEENLFVNMSKLVGLRINDSDVYNIYITKDMIGMGCRLVKQFSFMDMRTIGTFWKDAFYFDYNEYDANSYTIYYIV